MPITLPEKFFFDPYHESGIVITHTPDRIHLQLPRPSHLRFIPFYFFAVIFSGPTLFFALDPFVRETWPTRCGLLAFSAFGTLPILVCMFFRARHAEIEITPDHLLFTEYAKGSDPATARFPWDQIAAVSIGSIPLSEENPIGLIIRLRTGQEKEVLADHSIGELERLQALLKSLLPAPVQGATPMAE